ncbi:DUF1016 N-terminal domain-containing protein [Streptomyces sp. PTD5-9]|uniref:DUF1016 N-terminal domain-containing protein n=1 Tax=Streptomyces sp. PTD5-9 TaxID=3120150 RepID=UPI00300B92E8
MGADLKSIVRGSRVRAQLEVNTEMLRMHWEIGRVVLERQGREKWVAEITERIATELRTDFPDQRGFNTRNLQYMQQLARKWDGSFAQQAVAQMPWGHVITLMSTCKTRFVLDFHAQHAVYRDPERDDQTLGILVAESRDETIVEFALQLRNQPLAVSPYATLPPGVRELMPTSEDLFRVARQALRPDGNADGDGSGDGGDGSRDDGGVPGPCRTPPGAAPGP